VRVDFMAVFRTHRGMHESNVSAADNNDFHNLLIIKFVWIVVGSYFFGTMINKKAILRLSKAPAMSLAE
jgi:hypothetical protein